MISVSVVNSPQASTPIDFSSVIKSFMVDLGAGFPEVWYVNPTLVGSTGLGMKFPTGMTGAAWRSACSWAALGGAVLIPRIGGGATNDIPQGGALDTAIKRFRPSPTIGCDQVSDDPPGSDSERMCRTILANNMTVAPEGNSKAQPWNVELIDAIPERVSPMGQWWQWPLDIPGAKSAWNTRRWRFDELLDLGSTPIVEVNLDNNGHGVGFPTSLSGGAWASARMDIVRAIRKVSHDIKIVVRPTGLSSGQLDELRGMNR